MKKKIAIIVSTLVALGALAIAPMVLAGPHGRGHGAHGAAFGGSEMGGFGFGPLARLGMLRERLDLTDSQADQIRAIFRETHEKNAPYREQLHGGIKGIAETLLADPNDLTRAQALLDQQVAAERALKANILNGTSKALGVLTAEQRAELGTILAEHAARREHRGR